MILTQMSGVVRIGRPLGPGPAGRVRGAGDGADELDDAVDAGRIPAGRPGRAVDAVLGRRLGLVAGGERRDPAVRLAAGKVEHPGADGAEPHADAVQLGRQLRADPLTQGRNWAIGRF
jgi:hypothetical protein